MGVKNYEISSKNRSRSNISARSVKNFVTPTFLALSNNLREEKPLSLPLACQQFDLNTLFSRIWLPFLNTLEQNYRLKKDAPPILLLESWKDTHAYNNCFSYESNY